ncbi:ABC transporter permease [Acidiferrimicrobium sp. IK]|uniref:cell division protein FtsX n=1 Tax=Acidiferrimicrobium sp. IK TaxID=2871700 RepID=UPI0021CB82F1|nr:ABC transporter permease [Acidiferrimicrobium sp. IK]MCU4185677.1 ABC transporter permease [Acidiferrimicrobium sp. IK]
MPVSVGYVARETGGNLRRNLLMTIAAILTMAVSLGALGVVLVTRQAVSKATLQWRGGVQVAIFMQPSASSNQVGAVGHELSSMPGIRSYHFVDKPHAYAEFKQIFAGQPDLLQALDVNSMPTSYRVVPVRAQDAAQLARQFQGQPGVRTVTYAQQEIAKLVKTSHQLRYGASVIAAVVMIGAIALIINTIQLAIFARRREVAVMKLVGATNWFIRIPFMIEGLVHGLVGAVAAFVFTYFLRNTIASFVSNNSPFAITKILISPHEAFLTGLVVLVVGAAIGALGSAFAVRRFLAV